MHSATSGAGTVFPSGTHEFTLAISGVPVAQSLALCLVIIVLRLAASDYPLSHLSSIPIVSYFKLCLIVVASFYFISASKTLVKDRLKYTLENSSAYLDHACF